MRDDLKTAYLWMREHHKKPIEEVKTYLKVLKVKKYDVSHMSRMEYPEITMEKKMAKIGFSQKQIFRMWNCLCFT